MSTPRTTPPDETARHALAAALLGLTAAGIFPLLLGVGLAALASGSAASRMVRRRRELKRRRASADALLAGIPGTRVPDRLSWRAAELTSPSHRREIAHQLERFARIAGQPLVISSVPVFSSTLRPNRAELASVAAIVGNVEQPVTSRGMLLLERLLGNAGLSPLYQPRHAAELEQALTLVHRAIEP